MQLIRSGSKNKITVPDIVFQNTTHGTGRSTITVWCRCLLFA